MLDFLSFCTVRVPPNLWLYLLTILLGFGASSVAAADGGARIENYRCEQVVHLGLNESYKISLFPPHKEAYYGPQECTLVFESRDCQLEFRQRTSKYVRGNIDCNEQYFLIGDEHREERFCGFKKPPLRLKSTGTQLFITHYQRNNGYYSEGVGTSRLSGFVRCRQRPAPPPPPVCPPSERVCKEVTPKQCTALICDMSSSITSPVQNTTNTIGCDAEGAHTCTNTGQMCFQTVTTNSPVPTLPAPPAISGAPDCTQPIQITCPTSENCTAHFDLKVSFVVHNTADLECVTGPECTCIFQANACYIRT